MAHTSELIADDIDAYLISHQYKSLLRFITCGSVDDGKSTLIGRLHVRHQAPDLRGPARGTSKPSQPRRARRRENVELRPAHSTASRPSASRASRSTSPTGSSRPNDASSSSPTHPATSSTRATWSPVRRPPTWPCSWSTPARACSPRPGGTCDDRVICSASGTSSLAVNKMDLVDLQSQDTLRRDRRRSSDDVRAARLGHRPAPSFIPMSRARRRQRHRAAARRWTGTTGPPCSRYLETIDTDDGTPPRHRAVPPAGAVGLNRPDLDFRGFCGHAWSAGRSGRATRSVVLPAGDQETTVKSDRHVRWRTALGRRWRSPISR